MQVKDELRVLVEAEVARAIENFKKLSGGIEDAENKSVSLGEALDSFSKKSLVVSGILGGAGIAAVKFAGENEKLKFSLKNITSSAEEAAAVFEDWRKLGASPGLSADEVFDLGRAMVNMGKDTEYVTTTIKMLGNISAGTSASFGEISGSFERARAMGNLTARDLVRLQQQGIPVVKQLSKELGISEESVRNLAAEGKIGFNDLEKAFRSMTSPGGQFAGMMDELSGTVLEKFSSAADDAKQALASFGEMMLPMATDMLNNASSVLRGISGMDEGAKRFILGMGGVIAVSGPAIAAVKGISAAMSLVMANPYMLAIGGVIAAAGIVTGIINKQANAYGDLNIEIHKTKNEANNLLRAYSDGNNAKILDKNTTEELIKLYPSLSGEITAYKTTVDEATEAVKRLTHAEVENAANKQIEKLRRQAEAAEEAASAYDRYAEGAVKNIEIAERLGDAFSVRGYEDALGTYKQSWDDALEKAEKTRRGINSELAKIGKMLGDDFGIIDIPVNITPIVDIDDLDKSVINNVKKSWQEWFGEITDIDPSLFGDSGRKAAELYIGEFERGLTAQTVIAEALGEQLDVSKLLRSRQSEVQSALTELFAINPDDINRPFALIQPEIQKLTEEYRRLGEEAKRFEDIQKADAIQKEFTETVKNLTAKIDGLGKSEHQLAYESELARIGLEAQSEAALELAQTMNRLSVESTLSGLSREVQNLGKDQYDLSLTAMAASDATEEEIKKAEEMIETLRRYGMSIDDLIAHKVSGGLLNIFPEMEKQAAQAIGNITSQLAMMSFDNVINGLSAVGELFAKGSDGVDDFKQAMADMAQQILNSLPNMFLQAGLQLIAQGQWALGLGFIAAAGSSAVVAGYVKGKKETVSENAHGNVYGSNGVIPYAHGSVFTNQIVNKPTYFKHGGKLGVMGEAGPESIMPLRRMANGDLGVAASGANTEVTVNIINNSGEAVRKEERADSDGNKQIDVIIGELINKHIASGKADRAMSRYNVRPAGV
ncbi:MAG: tape measure protein [Treponema sp.]|nr:tape measure protein [Treponema sp.]